MAHGQQWGNASWGLRIGVSGQLGTKVNRLGLILGGYVVQGRWEVNSDLRWLYHFGRLGPSVRGGEWQWSAALLGGWGKGKSKRDELLLALQNHTNYRHALSYGINWYQDAQTPQWTGSMGVFVDRFEFLLENDAFVFRGKDQFRTGAIELAYRVDVHTRLALEALMWTGNPHEAACRWVREAGDYPCRYGYRDLSASAMGDLSHGILTMQVQRSLSWGNWGEAKVGVDAEQVRHFLQNKLIHDGIRLPAGWKGPENPHIPMLDQAGKPYLFQEDQWIRSPRFYGGLGLNEGLFY